MSRISELQVDFQHNPIGIDNNPHFFWKIISDEQNVFQTHYTLTVAADAHFKAIISYKEGKDESVAVELNKLPLDNLRRYYWKVEATLNNGESLESETYQFVTGYIDKSFWQAEMISGETEDDAINSKGTYLKHEFQIKDEDIEDAFLSCTAFGFYHVYIDGNRVGNDELTPGWTSYHKHLMYQIYDIKNMLHGKNHCIGAHLGAGYYKGLMGFLGLRNNYGKRTGFCAELIIRYKSGKVDVIKTDDSWLSIDSPIVFSEIYDGEIYDARKEIDNWCDYGADSKGWRKTTPLDFDKNTLSAQTGCKTKMQECFPVKELIITPNKEKVLDFGQNLAGWLEIEIEGANPGDIVELECFEMLDANGNVYVDNLRGAKNSIKYICKGVGIEKYHPNFTYQGYRYAKVTSWAGVEKKINDVKSYAVYSDMPKTGKFICSNKNLNQLWSNITWSLKSNFVTIPTDCPQRNERVGWTGDAQIFCPTANYIVNTYLFFERWLKDVAYDQTTEGGVPHVVPDIITPNIDKVNDWLCSQGTHSAAAWADVAVLNPWNMYLSYGDKRILIEQYYSMKKWIDFMERHAKDGIWDYKLQFGDWVALDAEEGSYFGATPNALTCTAYYALSTQVFSEVAKIIGNDKDYNYYSRLAKRVKKNFQEKFFDKNTKGMTVQTQTAHIIALYFNLTPEEYRENTAKELVELLNKENGHLVTGFVGTPYFTHALSQNGYLKEAYSLLLKNDFPSWLYQVEKGATTIWEHWDGLKPDGTMWSADMNSFNHYAYGSIGEWLVRVIGGLNIDKNNPGYKNTIIYPQPGGGITAAECEYDTVYGKIKSEWTLDNLNLKLVVDIPANTAADIRLDNVRAVLSDYKKGKLKNRIFNAKVGSGHYELMLELYKGDENGN